MLHCHDVEVAPTQAIIHHLPNMLLAFFCIFSLCRKLDAHIHFKFTFVSLFSFVWFLPTDGNENIKHSFGDELAEMIRIHCFQIFPHRFDTFVYFCCSVVVSIWNVEIERIWRTPTYFKFKTEAMQFLKWQWTNSPAYKTSLNQ